MLSVEEARARCESATPPPRRERLAVQAALGRFLAEEQRAPGPLPPWDNSAMDGYALLAADTRGEAGGDCDHGPSASAEGVVLEVLETVPAGRVARQAVRAGTTIRVMTGAPVPAGADAVVMREDAEVLPGQPERVRIRGAAKVGQHIRHQGSERRPGDLLLPAGARLSPGAIGLLAAAGIAEVEVFARPRVGLVATGDELQAPGRPLGPGQIHASNSEALGAWILQAGGEVLDGGIAPDELAGTRAAFQRLLDQGPDLILSTGGVSVGDFDVVKEAFASLGVEMDFWKVKMKPGKPLAFGRIGATPLFGLPGNPVSCQVNFLQFVRPVLRRMLGDPRPYLPQVEARLVAPIRKAPGRAELVRLALQVDEEGVFLARPTGDQGSGQSSSMAWGHGLGLLAEENAGLSEGQRVAVQVFDWSFLDRAERATRWTR